MGTSVPERELSAPGPTQSRSGVGCARSSSLPALALPIGSSEFRTSKGLRGRSLLSLKAGVRLVAVAKDLVHGRHANSRGPETCLADAAARQLRKLRWKTHRRQ